MKPFPLTAATIALREALPPNATEADLMMMCKAHGLMEGYDARWGDAGWTTLAVEQEFHLPIVNPDTKAKSKTFTQAGKYDGIIEHSKRSGAAYLLEHKTTSDDISDPNSPYFRRLTIDAQVSAYVLANWQAGNKLEGTLYDVIRKPGIRARKLTKAELASVVSSGTYFGKRFSREVQIEYSSGRESESPELFAARLAHDCKERPGWYFARRIVPRLDTDVAEYAGELWDVATEIRLAGANKRWFRNSGACMNYHTPCQFLGICSGHGSFDDGRWKRKDKPHAELNVADSGVLTHSSMSVFKACRKKYFYQHVEQYEKADEETAEALRFGTMFHEALAAWWRCFMVPSNEVSNEHDCTAGNESADSGAGGAPELV